MSSIYVIDSQGETSSMERIHCVNEDRELQALLEKNLDLLPGDQINPDNPRKWLLIKREMPVPDPGSGLNRWSIDFLLVDQDGMPTFVECKRYNDTRSRREVVGQMIEYAANGHYYWDKNLLQEMADQSAKQAGQDLETLLSNIGENDKSVDEFFAGVQENLREAQIRIVFFLEKAPDELRSIVDFLNRQMERSEVLLVEARQYERAGMRVVAPMLFGYTEAARRVKRTVTVKTSGDRRKWDLQSFLADASANLPANVVNRLKELYEGCLRIGCKVKWGSGSKTGSFNVVVPGAAPRSLVTINSDGSIVFNFGWLTAEDVQSGLRAELESFATETMNLEVPSMNGEVYPRYPAEKWIEYSVDLLDFLTRLASRYN